MGLLLDLTKALEVYSHTGINGVTHEWVLKG
jgi:hypothetical protein